MSYRTDMQSVVYNKVICDWRHVNKGTTQGRANGSYLLIFIFLNDLEINVGGETVLNMLMTAQLLFLSLRTMTQHLHLLISY